MSDPGNSLDDHIRLLKTKQHEIENITKTIRESGHDAVVAFVDLVGSTEAKMAAPDKWLSIVYGFLTAVSEHASSHGGTVVKRIGDELLLTFESWQAFEAFLDALTADTSVAYGSYKIALDYGTTYPLNFGQAIQDPYGSVVDRCARIAKLAAPGAILASASYGMRAGESWRSAGSFNFKGFDELQEVYFRKPPNGNEDYLRPLLEALRKESKDTESYRLVPRPITPTYLASVGQSPSAGRPFLVRALFNVPRISETPQALDTRLRELPKVARRREERLLVGYYIEWELAFSEICEGNDRVILHVPNARTYDLVFVSIVPSMLDVVSRFVEGERVRLRGIIMKVPPDAFYVDYADFEIVDRHPESAPPEPATNDRPSSQRRGLFSRLKDLW